MLLLPPLTKLPVCLGCGKELAIFEQVQVYGAFQFVVRVRVAVATSLAVLSMKAPAELLERARGAL